MTMYRFSLFVWILLVTQPIINGLQTQKLENPTAREARILHRQPEQLNTSRESFMQRILAKIQGPSTLPPPPTTTARVLQPQILQPLIYNYYPPSAPQFVYRHPPYLRREKSEPLKVEVASSNDSNVDASSYTSTTVAPPPISSEKPVILTVKPPRFHRGPIPQPESDSISIPILRSDIPVIQDPERKIVQKSAQAPKCYISQNSLMPLPPMPLPLYNNYGYGFPFGYQHLQPHSFPGPYGNPLFSSHPYMKYPIIYFVLPKKKPVNNEPFDLIALEENNVSQPALAPPPMLKPQESSKVEHTTEPSQKETLENFSASSLSKPTSTAESSIEEIVEIDVDPVAKKLLDMLTGVSHPPTIGEEKPDKDLLNLPTLRPIESDVIEPEVKSHLKTVDVSETKNNVNTTTAVPRQRTRKYKF